MIGVSRATAAEFTFFLAVPVMFGASLLKAAKYILAGIAMTGGEALILLVGTVVAFIVSVFVIKFLMGYIKSMTLRYLAGTALYWVFLSF